VKWIGRWLIGERAAECWGSCWGRGVEAGKPPNQAVFPKESSWIRRSPVRVHRRSGALARRRGGGRPPPCPGEQSVEMSRPRSPTIAAAANAVSPAPAPSSRIVSPGRDASSPSNHSRTGVKALSSCAPSAPNPAPSPPRSRSWYRESPRAPSGAIVGSPVGPRQAFQRLREPAPAQPRGMTEWNPPAVSLWTTRRGRCRMSRQADARPRSCGVIWLFFSSPQMSSSLPYSLAIALIRSRSGSSSDGGGRVRLRAGSLVSLIRFSTPPGVKMNSMRQPAPPTS
jgi:hypothetical protein